MRNEFPKPVRRAALLRAQGTCEAMGLVYGLAPGSRCHAPLAKGVEFDHYPIRASDGGPGTLENCVVVCLTCHRHKTTTFDIPEAAKGKRIRDRRTGVVSARSSRSRGRRGFLTNRSSPFKRKMSGEVVPRVRDPETGLSAISCVAGDLSFCDEPFAEEDGELCFCLDPLSWRPFPVLGRVSENEI